MSDAEAEPRSREPLARRMARPPADRRDSSEVKRSDPFWEGSESRNRNRAVT